MCGGRPSMPAPTPPPPPPPPIVTPIQPVTEGGALDPVAAANRQAGQQAAAGGLGDTTNKVTSKTLLGS